MDKFIFAFVDEDKEGLFRDLTSDEAKTRIDFLPTHKRYSNKLINMIEKVCLSYQLNKRIHVPFQSVFYNLDAYDYNSRDTYHMLMPTTSISKYTIKYLKEFKNKHKNVHLYALVTDSMHASSPHMDLVRNKLFSDVWDRVLTYDKYDADEFGFTWFGYTCYSTFDFVEADAIESDLYYIGFNKGNRERVVNDIYTSLAQKKCNCRFDVVASENDPDIAPFPYLKSHIAYPEVVSRVKSCNCILEVLQENQKSPSMRYFESVFYNKKLLTTNKNITELPFYDSRYMRYIDEIENIDIEWIQKKETINYEYNGQLSPIKLFDFIMKI